MKQIILSLSLILIVGMSFGQIKVISNGNVGIGGLDSPSDALEVNGDVTTHGAKFNVAEGITSGTAILNIGKGRTNTSIASIDMYNKPGGFGFRFSRSGNGATTLTHNGEKPIQFKYLTQGAKIQFLGFGGEHMRIESGGFIGMGVGNPQAKLHVNGDIMYNGSLISSDRRLKKDINEFNLGLDAIMKIQPYTYYYNGKADIQSDKLQWGVMAQDLAEIVPEAVGTYKYQKFDSKNYDTVESEEEYLYMNNASITYILVNAIKEQQQQIESKDAIIEEMSGRLDAIESLLSNGNVAGPNQTQVTLTYHDLADLGQNSPNPFNGTTQVSYKVPSDANSAEVEIFDQNGRRIKSLPILHTGEGVLTINASDVPSGFYSYRLIVDGKNIGTKKMVLSN